MQVAYARVKGEPKDFSTRENGTGKVLHILIRRLAKHSDENCECARETGPNIELGSQSACVQCSFVSRDYLYVCDAALV